MNLEEAKEIIAFYQNGAALSLGRRAGKSSFLMAKLYLEGYSQGKKDEREKAEKLVGAAEKLINSIGWSGDINQGYLAPKISVLSQALSEYAAQSEDKKEGVNP